MKGKSGRLYFGLILVVLLTVAAIVGNLWPLHSTTAMDIEHRLLPPTWIHPFGTDEYGRDVFSRAISALGPSLLVGIGATLCGLLVGGLIGLVSGYVSGPTDSTLMRAMDGLYAFPHLLLALLILTALGPGLGNTIAAIGLFQVPVFARIVRADVLRTRKAEFVVAAISYGCPSSRILTHHILPATIPTALTQASSSFGVSILIEATLSFLGFGIQPPTASLGNMLFEYRPLMQMDPWLPVFPGVLLLLVVLGFNFMTDGLRERLMAKQ